MAAEQQQGKSFEKLIIDRSGQFPRAEGHEFGATDEFDVPADLTEDGLPVSIKSKKNSPWKGASPAIEMSDALRFFRNSTSGPMRLIAGLYDSSDGRARFYEIHELQTDPCLKRWLWGDLEEDDIAEFILKIRTWAAADTAAGRPKRERAQEKARRHKSRLLPRAGLVSLNQKINSTNSRLQCSINLFHLGRMCREKGLPVRIFSAEADDPCFGKILLPVHVATGARSRRAE